jgi:hypothetical protein
MVKKLARELAHIREALADLKLGPLCSCGYMVLTERVHWDGQLTEITLGEDSCPVCGKPIDPKLVTCVVEIVVVDREQAQQVQAAIAERENEYA